MSRLVEAIVLPSNDMKLVLKLIKKHIFTRFGNLEVMISDGGTYFINNFVQTFVVHVWSET